jgi:hypothetical protein
MPLSPNFERFELSTLVGLEKIKGIKFNRCRECRHTIPGNECPLSTNVWVSSESDSAPNIKQAYKN